VAATLHLARGGIIMELRRGPFHVLLDGNDIGSIESDQTIGIPIEPGHHELQVKTGRYTSPRHPFDTVDGEIVSFRCYGGRIWPIYLASFVKPDLALTLQRE
jgi:hypothetical protein